MRNHLVEYGQALLEARDLARLQLARIAHHNIQVIRLQSHPKPQAIIAILVARNEAHRLLDCLRHHREIGVDRFAILDNGSSDETLNLLADQPDVDLYATTAPYAESRNGSFWRSWLLRRYGHGRWYLTIDADELLVYADMSRRDLHDLGAFLRSWSAKMFFAPMIDMYSDRPLNEVIYRSGDKQIDACPFFDGDSYRVCRSHHWIVGLEGGPRARLFGSKALLRKHPFFYWDKTGRRPNGHEYRAFGSRLAPSGALLHFKFLPDLNEKISYAIESRAYYNEGAEYRSYRDGLQESSSISYEGSRKYYGPESLIAAKLMQKIHWGSKRPTRSLLVSALSSRPLYSSIEVADR